MPARRRLPIEMTNPNGRSFSRDPDEHELLRTVDASVALQQLLAAAAAPPSATELKGRSRAVAEFRAAQLSSSVRPPADGSLEGQKTAAIQLHPSDRPNRTSPGRISRAVRSRRGSVPHRPRFTCVGRWSAARLTVACAALVTVLGGTAAAAAAGELPVPVRNAVAQLFATEPAGRTPTPAAPSTRGTAAPTTGSGARPGKVSTSRAAAPTVAASRPAIAHARPPQLRGLCQAYLSRGRSVGSVATLAEPGFAPLIAAAGGAANVSAFCAGLIPQATVSPPVAPSHPRASTHSSVRASPARSAATHPAHPAQSANRSHSKQASASHGRPAVPPGHR
jgi:hypothetical protein